jgi:hypothetical protein
MAEIHEAIAAIMADVGSIAKDKRNAAQGYNFRGIEDVYSAVHPLFIKHGVFSVPEVIAERSEERQGKSGGALIYRILTIRYTFFAKDGSSIQAVVIGEGMDSGDKASNKAQSVAHKYAIIQLLAIPTSDAIDPEQDSHEIAPKASNRAATASEPPPAKVDPPELAEIKELASELNLAADEKKRIFALYTTATGTDFPAILRQLKKMKADLALPAGDAKRAEGRNARIAEMFEDLPNA